jgi:excisionase family DNA binding protein
MSDPATMQGDKLWGATEIARFLGVSVETVYAWSGDREIPIYKPGGRYFALRSELRTWLRQKPGETPNFPDLQG